MLFAQVRRSKTTVGSITVALVNASAPHVDLTQNQADTGEPTSQASPADDTADESDCVALAGEAKATLTPLNANVAALFAKVLRSKKPAGRTTATVASAETRKRAPSKILPRCRQDHFVSLARQHHRVSI